MTSDENEDFPIAGAKVTTNSESANISDAFSQMRAIFLWTNAAQKDYTLDNIIRQRLRFTEPLP